MGHLNGPEKFLEEIKQFCNEEIRPFALTFDKEKRIPRELIQKMGTKGYLGANFPTKYGGLGLDPEFYGKMTEEIGKACCSTRSLLTVHSSVVGETLLRYANKDQIARYIYAMARGEKIGAFALTEPKRGSDAKSILAFGKKQGDHFILNGKKKWITFGDVADFFLVIALVEDKISALLVDRDYDGVTTKPIEGLMAAKSAHIAEIEFENVAVPVNNLVGNLGAGFSFIASTALDHGRYSVAWAGVSIAQAALEKMVNYSRLREQFGQKIHNFQLIQGLIADATTSVHAARALCLRAAELRKKKDPDAVMETTIAKYFASKVALKVCMDAVQVHGANGLHEEFGVERLFREAKVIEIIEGSSQIQQIMIARFSLQDNYRKDAYPDEIMQQI